MSRSKNRSASRRRRHQKAPSRFSYVRDLVVEREIRLAELEAKSEARLARDRARGRFVNPPRPVAMRRPQRG